MIFKRKYRDIVCLRHSMMFEQEAHRFPRQRHRKTQFRQTWAAGNSSFNRKRESKASSLCIVQFFGGKGRRKG